MVKSTARFHRGWFSGVPLSFGAVEGEILFVDRLGQDVRISVERVDDELVLEHLERRSADSARNALERARLGDEQLVDVGAVAP